MTEKEEQLYRDRLKKMEGLRAARINPYPSEVSRTHSIRSSLEKFRELESKKEKLTLTGRIRSLRGHGAVLFGNFEDGTGEIQFMLKEDVIGAEKLREFQRFFDIGDFLQAAGTFMTTKKGERTLLLQDFKILSKSLRALPEKWHGLADIETKLRKRYLDLIANPEVRDIFRKKNLFWQAVRNFLAQRDFLEVQTPVLESIPGGADATPFVTHHEALDRDFYLRISLELPLKRLLVGGYDKVFEIGRLFRNEGLDREHLQEYDDMEFYWAYSDHRDGMKLVEDLFKDIVKKVTGAPITVYEGKRIDWGKKWEEVDYFESFKKHTGIDLNGEVGLEEMYRKADKLKIVYDKSYGTGKMIDSIFKKIIRPKLIGPCFLTGQPVEISPLAKKDPENPKRVLRFQVMAGGSELGNGFSELNDPIDQRKRFEEQMKLREKGDEEAQMMDEDFVEALEYGMPPAVGFGMSERFFAVLMDKSIRETVIFPPMREK